MRIGKQTQVVNGGLYNVPTMVGVVLCDTSKGKCTIVIPNILSSRADALGYRLIIQDIGDNAENNNITIVVGNIKNEKINGQPNLVMSTNGGAVRLDPFGDFYWVATPSVESSVQAGLIKSGLAKADTFGGSPLIQKAQVTFTVPFKDSNYSPSLQILSSDNFNPTIEELNKNGFIISLNSTVKPTQNVLWSAIKHGGL